MKITMITPYFYPQYGGVENQCRAMSQRFVQEGHDVEVVTLKLTPSSSQREILDSFKVKRFGNGTSTVGRSIGYLQMAIHLLMAARDTDILHQHLVYGAGIRQELLLGYIVKKFLGKPWIIKITSTNKVKMTSWLFAGQWLVNQPDKIVAMNTAIHRELIDAGVPKEKIVDVTNGVDEKHFRPLREHRIKARLRKSLGLPLNIPLVIYTGRLTKKKGLDTLFYAWKQLARESLEAKLLLVGDDKWDRLKNNDPYGDQLGELYRQLDLKDILFVGAVKNVGEYYQASDIFVLPSRNEGIPNSLLEAMSTGLAVVGSDIPGISDVVIKDEENGTIVPVDNPNKLAVAIKNLILNEPKRRQHGQKARWTIEEKFTFDRIANYYLERYQKMLS